MSQPSLFRVQARDGTGFLVAFHPSPVDQFTAGLFFLVSSPITFLCGGHQWSLSSTAQGVVTLLLLYSYHQTLGSTGRQEARLEAGAGILHSIPGDSDPHPQKSG